MKTIAIIGASPDRAKFGNKALRAYRQRGFRVFPVNPHGEEIEGLRCYRSITEVPERPDRVSLYLPPSVGITLLKAIAEKGCDELWVNPGAESTELIETAEQLGLKVIQACSIMEVGLSPAAF